MTFVYLLLEFFVVSVAVGRHSVNLLNQCPQPTESNPDPPGFVYAHPEDCRYYFTCDQGKPKLRQCKPHDRARYSEFYHTCVGVNTAFDTCTSSNAQRECRRGMSGLIAHPSLCHRYYNCSQTPIKRHVSLGDYEAECPYPQLFDTETRRCTPVREVSCGFNRQLPKDPCDYAKIQCPGSNCLPCSSKAPSCAGLEDGFHSYPGRQWSKFYISCHQERLKEMLTCKKHAQTGTEAFFSPIKKKCVSRWEVPKSTGHGAAPSCEGKLLGIYTIAERPEIYFSCPTGDVFYCESRTVFNEFSYLCEKRLDN